MAPGAPASMASFTIHPAKDSVRSSPSDSWPMLVHTSVFTTSHPSTARFGSCTSVTFAPARATSDAGGMCPRGPERTRWNPKSVAASSQERAMLLAQSPTKATRRPAMGPPRASSTVSTSQSTCTGCPSSDSALITGTRAVAISRRRAVVEVRNTMASQ